MVWENNIFIEKTEVRAKRGQHICESGTTPQQLQMLQTHTWDHLAHQTKLSLSVQTSLECSARRKNGCISYAANPSRTVDLGMYGYSFSCAMHNDCMPEVRYFICPNRESESNYSGTSVLGHLSGWVTSQLGSLLPSPVGNPNTEVPLYMMHWGSGQVQWTCTGWNKMSSTTTCSR